MAKKIRRVEAREGYDLWAESYDRTPNPVVAMDARYALNLLAPKPGEHILDAGCGTGRHLGPLKHARSLPVGIDFSLGMLRVARRNHPDLPLALVDLERPLPFRVACFDAVLCALIGEHLRALPLVLQEFYRVLKPEGRLAFTVYHPEMAAAGIEANFERQGVEYRLGAYLHTLADYTGLLEAAGFRALTRQEFRGDQELIKSIPRAAKYLGFPLLLALGAKK